VTGKCGSVTVRFIPASRGTGIVSAPVPKKLLNMAGIEDCYTSARGCTATLGNFGKYFTLDEDLIPRKETSSVGHYFILLIKNYFMQKTEKRKLFMKPGR